MTLGELMKRIIFVRKKMIGAVAATAFLISTFSTKAQADLVLTQITEGDFREISREISNNFTHTSVSGASSLGSLYGFQLGLVYGMTKTPNLNNYAQRSANSSDIKQIPHGGLLGVVTIPMGISFEALYLPSTGPKELKGKNTSLAVKWTLTDMILDLPVALAVKGFYTNASLKTEQTVSGGNQNINLTDKMMGFEVLVSQTFGIVEPYVGLIQSRADVDMSVSGSGSVFSTSYTAGQNASTRTSSTGYLLGAELKLLFFHAGAEFTRVFGANRYTAKLAFSF